VAKIVSNGEFIMENGDCDDFGFLTCKLSVLGRLNSKMGKIFALFSDTST
jgi:hypothetical protein